MKKFLLSLLLATSSCLSFAGEKKVQLESDDEKLGRAFVGDDYQFNLSNRYDDSILVRAIPAAPWIKFDHWSDGSKVAKRYYKGKNIDTLTAYFKRADQELNTSYAFERDPSGFGYATERLDEPFYMATVIDTQTVEYVYKTLSITANSEPGYKFSKWEDGSLDNPRNITLGKDLKVGDNLVFQPTFEEMFCNIVVVSSDTTMGTATGSGKYGWGEKIRLEYTEKDGYVFEKIVSSRNDLLAYGDDTITVYFKKKEQYNVVFVSADTTMGTVSEGGMFTYGEDFDIKAYPKYGYNVGKRVSTNGLSLNFAQGDDTITVYFDRDSTRHRIYMESNETLDFYGVMLENRWAISNSDTIEVTNLKNGEVTVYLKEAMVTTYAGDSLQVVIKPDDTHNIVSFTNNSFLLTYDAEKNFVNHADSITRHLGSIKSEEAEGDSFEVKAVYQIEGCGHFEDIIRLCEGSGHYANGDTAEVQLLGGFYSYIDENDIKHQFRVPETTILITGNADFYTWDAVTKVNNVPSETLGDNLVNVYTFGGKLLKKNVRESEALDGLGKGLYIVGRKKVRITE